MGQLVWVDRQGRVEPVTADTRAYNAELALSRDGTKLAVSIIGPEYDNLWAYHIREQRWQQFTSTADEESPLWSPGGDRLAFASNRDGPLNIYVARSDGERPERLTRSPRSQVPISWSPDGRFIAYQEGFANLDPAARRRSEAVALGAGAVGLPVPGVLARRPLGGVPVARDRRRPSRRQLQRARPPVPGGRAEADRLGARRRHRTGVVARRPGVLFLPGLRTPIPILAVDVSPGPTLRFSEPHVAFALPFGLWSMHPFALAPDGQRLVMVRRDEGIPTEVRSLALVRNWAQEVKAKVR